MADEVRAELAEKGQATVWVHFEQQAQLAAARSTSDWDERGERVMAALKANADASQAEVRDLLTEQGIDFTSYWVVNAIQVTAGLDVVTDIAGQPGVAEILADRTYEVPEPIRADAPGVDAVEWNIDRVRAPEVWDGFGIRGEGVVVGSIDTGADYAHPALVNQYRGNLGGGEFDHNYNWFDPSVICGSPSTVPCDNDGHGTHTMGTTLGDDGAENQIGVAPGARWISAKGCEYNSCSLEALMASFQWLLAPTDLNGENPRPDLRPNVVNNSWGGPSGDPLFQEAVQAWVAAGIFPVFSAGNDGYFGCSTTGSPGDYPESYAVGAFDSNDVIADFSSRGPSFIDGSIKPDIAAPGVNIRSSTPWGYDYLSGTSMAAPHVTGTVALMLSAAPTLLGDVEATKALLDETAVDKSDLQCGGEPENNNVWGEGTLDAFTAVDLSPRGPTGYLSGVVTDQATGAPVPGALVEAAGPSDRRTVTDEDGSYSMRLPVGDYDVTVSAFAYGTVTAEATVTEDATTTLDIALEPVPSHAVSGTVVDDDGDPVVGAQVSVLGTPIAEVTTGDDGTFTIPSVPEGEYEIEADPNGCFQPQVQPVVVDGAETVSFTVEQTADQYGNTCDTIPGNYIEGTTRVDLIGDDYAVPVDLGFGFWFYGRGYSRAWVNPNGNVNFQGPGYACCNTVIPEPNQPNAAIYPFWDDLYIDDASSVWTRNLGSGRNRQFLIEWRNVSFTADFSQRVSFEIILGENGDIEMHYRDIEGGLDQGVDATVGIENHSGDDALQFSYNEPILRNDTGIRFDAPDTAFVSGTVLDSSDGSRLEGATVRAIQDGNVVKAYTTQSNGVYIFRLPLGTYTIEADFRGDASESATVELTRDNEWRVHNFTLELPGIEVSPEALDLVVPEGETRTRQLTVTNTGAADLEFDVLERSVADPAGEPATPPAGDGRTAPAGYQPTAATPAVAGGPVLLVLDYLPWGSNAMSELLTENEIEFDLVGSAELATIDLGAYQSVIISNDQPQYFYDALRAAIPRLTAYVERGGFLWIGTVSGYNGGNIGSVTFPGGTTAVSWYDSQNDVVAPEHPIVQGVPDPFNGAGSYSVFENVPEDATVITRAFYDGRPTAVEYDYGAGRVLATGHPLEYAYSYGDVVGRILENAVPYVNTFDSDEDVPWLSVAPQSGTLAPGATTTLDVTVDTTGIEPGLHRARVLVLSNDPRRPAVQVAVTLLVPAYQRTIDVGATDSFVDVDGDTWTADLQYTAGQWGYTNGRSSPLTTTRAIGGTDEDELFQTARNNPSEYRFDNVPNGLYEIDLRFAEINGRAPGRRLADVIAEQSMLLPAHDISNEVGTFNADQHTTTVMVTDGQLNVRLVPREGTAVPILNGLQVTHRTDR